jgi:hypothetical protein
MRQLDAVASLSLSLSCLWRLAARRPYRPVWPVGSSSPAGGWGGRGIWGFALLWCSASTVALSAVLGVVPVAAWAEACPNAVYRVGPSAQLPDCRAYELVTPSYKEGYEVFPDPEAVSEDGSSVLSNSLGAFAGAENSLFMTGIGNLSSIGAQYALVRGGSGWSPAQLELPASRYPLSALAAWSPGSGSSLWAAATPGRVAAAVAVGSSGDALVGLYLRVADGSIAEVGSVYPPSTPVSLGGSYWEYVASSGDLSRVLFGMTGFHWPGDGTREGDESLYEYAGVGNKTPMLVGVSGGPTSSDLISQCQTEAGTGVEESPGQGSVGSFAEALTGEPNLQATKLLHVVSRGGEKVFFTAVSDAGRFTRLGEPSPCPSSTPAPVVNELYARVENGEPGAHTVAISEPSKEDCAACETFEGEPTRRSPAYFVGASEDGSKVFFQTAQPLLGGDTSANIYEYDFDAPAGERIVRVSGGDGSVSNPTAGVLPGSERVSNDGSYVYFDASGVLTSAPNSMGQTAQEGADNLYVFERDARYPAGHTAFIATGSSGPKLSANGQFAVFLSSSDLTPDDRSSVGQLFEYDAQTGSLVRVSIGQDGYNENGNTSNQLDTPGLGEFPSARIVADDGAVFFESANGLTPQALDNVILPQANGSLALAQNVFEYRAGSVYLISDGQDLDGSFLDFIDPSGENVFFQTRDRLVAQDGDTQVDTYDARVDGGFPAPSVPVVCDGDACQGELSSTPVLLSPGSEFQAPSSPPPVSMAPVAVAKKQKKAGKKKARERKARVGSRRGKSGGKREMRATGGRGGRGRS